ncbi:MAG: hypothetical protein LBO65_03100 [Spirochaetaceae bacterium]|jgi:hypothetical protein|nr:hypothetical protein [Spirochaetaceae bacterium]
MGETRQSAGTGKEPAADDGRQVFYYSREARLQRASPAVQDLNKTSPPFKPTLWKTLTATPPLAFLFISIITLCVTIVILSRILTEGTTAVMGGNEITISALTLGEKSYITLEKNARTEDAYTGGVDMAVSLPAEPGTAPPVQGERVYFTLENPELFRFSVPFTGKKILILVEVKDERTLFTLTPVQRGR